MYCISIFLILPLKTCRVGTRSAGRRGGGAQARGAGQVTPTTGTMQEGAHKKLSFRSNICHGDRGVTVTGVTRGSEAKTTCCRV
jgi:hypothetical protein